MRGQLRRGGLFGERVSAGKKYWKKFWGEGGWEGEGGKSELSIK